MYTLSQVTDSWTYNHKHFLVTLSLALVVLLQAFPVRLPSEVLVYTAQAGEETRGDMLITELEVRTIEIYKQNYPINMQAAEVQALQEQQEQLMKLAKLVPEKNYKDLKQALEVFENTRP